MISAEVVIIGAGPAGISAAIQLKRYGINPIVFEKNEIGGLLRNANLVENYPGFPKGISGPKLIELFKKQFFGLGLEIVSSEVIHIENIKKQYVIETNIEKYITEYLIIASGTKANEFSKFKLPKKSENYIHYEVSSLLYEIGKSFVVVGAGDAAFDYSLNLSKNNQITILNRNDKINCLPLLWERVKQNGSITYYSNSEINGINWDGFKLEIKYNQSGKIKIVNSYYLIFAIGLKQNLNFITNENLINFDELNKKKNVFFIGDVKNGLFRQTSISVGDGVKTAMKIYNLKQESS